MIATTASVSTASQGSTSSVSASAATAHTMATRFAEEGEIAPDGNGRSGCATRSISISARSLVVFATAVSAIAASAARPTRPGTSPALHHAPAHTPAAASAALRQRTSASHSSGEDTRVECLVPIDDVVLREPLARVGGGGFAHCLPLLW